MTSQRVSESTLYLALGLGAAIVAACGGDPAVEVSTSTSAVAPAGSGATFVTHDVPTVVAPGERLPVAITFDNSGAASPANDWDTNYRLVNTLGGFFWSYTRLVGAVPVGGSYTYRFVITAPTAGTANFGARGFTDTPGQTGFFGDTVSVPNITVDPARTPRFGCALESSTLPATMNPGETRSVSITLRNAGTEAWTSGRYCLYSRDTPSNLWGPRTCVTLNQNVAGATQGVPNSGGTGTVTFDIVAPTNQTGAIPFRRQMFDFTSIGAGGVGFFSAVSNCVDTSISVAAVAAQYSSTFDPAGSNHDDAAMGTWAPSERRRVTIRLDNTGTGDWLTDGDFRLFSRNSPFTQWGPVTSFSVNQLTAPGSGFTHVMYLNAPAIDGSYASNWQMWSSRSVPNYFGPVVARTMTVATGAQRQFDAVVVSQNIPAVMATQEAATFRIRVRNTGWDAWSGSDFRLSSLNSPQALWGISAAPLGAAQTVAPGAEVEIAFAVVAPPTTGSYQSRWRMGLQSGAFTFGEEAVQTVEVAAGCGNGLTEPNRGEQCDDANTVSGDGCSATCLVEADTVDLTVDAADRTLFGRESARLLSNVALGDLDADGFPDLAAGSVNTTFPAGLTPRTLGGSVYVVPGAGMFSSTADGVGAAASLEVLGARASDQLGGGLGGSVVIADVTGPAGAADGVADLIVSSEAAACGDGNGSCGRVYVIRGGVDFPTGQLDLANPPAQLVATLVGPAAGSAALILGAGDLTGDGTADLVIGLPGDAGMDGRVVIVAGGVSLTGTQVLVGAALAAEILPAAAGDALGYVATVGDVSGDGQPDLLLGAAAHDPVARDTAGGAWAVFGPLLGTFDLNAGDFDVQWQGAGVRDKLGSALAVGDVAGTAANDVVLGVVGARFAGNARFGSVDVYLGPLVSGTTFDLAVATPAAVLQGREELGEMGRCAAVADMTGDGVGDILAVGSFQSGASGALTQAGELAVVRGGSTLASQTLSPGVVPLHVAGVSVGRMGLWPQTLATGDIDQDGRADVCVASPYGSVPGSGLVQEGRVDCFRSRW